MTLQTRTPIFPTNWYTEDGVRFVHVRNGDYDIVPSGYDSVKGKDVFALYHGGTKIAVSTSTDTLKRKAVRHSNGAEVSFTGR